MRYRKFRSQYGYLEDGMLRNYLLDAVDQPGLDLFHLRLKLLYLGILFGSNSGEVACTLVGVYFELGNFVRVALGLKL